MLSLEPPALRLRRLLRGVRDGALLVEFPEASDAEANGAAVALARSLSAAPASGFRDAIPAARTLLVLFDVRGASRGAVGEAIERAAARTEPAGGASRLVRIPVAYGGAAALDLEELARGAGLPESELASRHAAAEYRVAFLGFAPGFPYLTGLPAELRAARLASPRPRVPAGAVAIGGPWTGIYPAAMPGGWRLIGRTSARLFDAGASPAALLAAGDRVRFEPVAESALPVVGAAVARPRASGGRPAFRVEAPGFFASVQGAPRYGLGSSGVPPGGAMDLRSLARANALVGNGPDDPALEIALAGPELVALEDSVVALAGAGEIDGRPIPLAEAFLLPAGRRLRIGRVHGGARVYLAVGGGFDAGDAPGQPPPRLAGGQVLAVRPPSPARGPGRDPGGGEPGQERVLRVAAGPHSDHFEPPSVDRLLAASWRVSPVSDRRGLRLEGERLEHSRPAEVPPQGTVPGTIQVPGDGQPIVLGPDGPVTGGYPQIGTVIEADLPLLGQAAPGDRLRFRIATREDAEPGWRE